jgi:hypothetical protein
VVVSLTGVGAPGETDRHREEVPAYRAAQRVVQPLRRHVRPRRGIIVVQFHALEHDRSERGGLCEWWGGRNFEDRFSQTFNNLNFGRRSFFYFFCANSHATNFLNSFLQGAPRGRRSL